MLTFRLLQDHLLNRHRPQFNLGKALVSYSFAKYLEDNAQKAFIAQAALKIIRGFKREHYLRDTRSIRNRILDRAYFKSVLLSMIRPNA
jgi:hypothetical protein